MKTAIQIYVGAPLEHESERRFLRQLCSDLEAREASGLILANFSLPARKPVRQIDFLVLVACCACHVELKSFTAPVVGTANGRWKLRQPDGTEKPLDGENPYRQALECKYKVSDEMHAFAASRADVPRPPAGKKFYSLIESVVCVYPELMQGSDTPDDRYVHVQGYSQLVDFLTSVDRNPGWTPAHWVDFAMNLELMREETPEAKATDDASRAAAVVHDYCRRFKEFYGKDLPPLVPTCVQVGQTREKSDSILGFLTRGEHGQLVGKSGLGKSHHAIHMALSAIEGGRIPILVRAKHYEGKLSTLLDRSVAHLCPTTALQFIRAAKDAGKPLVLIVDGVNECRQALKDQLTENLLAFYLRSPIPIFMTSQKEITLPQELRGQTLVLSDLDDEERLAIVRVHATRDLPENVAELCRPFRSAYELSLAASCFHEVADRPNRGALFDAYVRRCHDKIATAAVTRVVLAEIADAMRLALTTSLSVAEAWRIAECALTEHGAPVTTLEDIMGSPLLDVGQAGCAFRHELLQRFFESGALARRFSGVDELTAELRKPAHHDLIEFVLDTQTESRSIRECLRVAVDVRAPSGIVGDCEIGYFGEPAREVVRHDIKRALVQAERDLEQLDIRVTEDSSGGELFLLEVNGGRDWSPYDLGLLDAVARNLHRGVFLEESLRLIGKTVDRCVEVLSARHGADSTSKRSFQSNLFRQLFVVGARGNCLPAANLVRAVEGRFVEGANREAVARVHEVFRHPDRSTVAEIYVCLHLDDGNIAPVEDTLPALVQYCWDSGIYHLQLEILRRTSSWALGVSELVAERIKDVLNGLPSSDLFLNTAIIETMCAYDMVESPVTARDVRHELAAILAQPESAEAQRAAMGAVENQFEEIFQGTYYDGIKALPLKHQVRLFTMAALGAGGCSFFTESVLQRLIDMADESALPAFLRFATTLEPETAFHQGMTARFILAHVGCAAYLETPAKLAQQPTDDHRAWQSYGEMLFWLHKAGLAPQEVSERCEPLWRRLESDLPFEAVDPLMWFAHAMITDLPREHHPVQRLFLAFRERLARILEFGLKNHEHLSSIDKRCPTHYWKDRERTTFIIHTLGQIGDADTVSVIEPYVEHEYHGRDAVEAIRRLHANEPFTCLQVLFRSP